MQIHFGTDTLHAEWPRSVVVIGTFDGVHLGHRAVIETAVEQARQAEEPCCLVTFDRHPAQILAPDRAPKAIASLASNLTMFAELGVSLALILPFDADLSRTSAESFFGQILSEKLRAATVVVGHDFAFGHRREGTPEWLRARVETTIVPPFEMNGNRVSSSAIRAAVAEGRIDDANRWLGKPFEMEGVVVGGQKLGRTLGFPTINLARSFDQILPADGVYAATAHCQFGRYDAALAIGHRPAAGGGPRSIEAYLLDYPGGSLYGRNVRLELRAFLRPEADFPSLDALKEQMDRDVSTVRTVLNG